jgi:Leucine-rich repeat (LRR) protein
MRISSLIPGGFVGLDNLLSLDLTWNSITSLPSGAFTGLGKLASLGLQTSLQAIASGAFMGLNSLQSLQLSLKPGMTLSTSGMFSGMPGLKKLILKSCGIAGFTSGAFKGLEKLEFIDLSSNSISTIPSGGFAGLSSVKSLLIGDNPMETGSLANLNAGTFVGLDNLRELNLGLFGTGNGMPSTLLNGLEKLEALIIESVGLSSIPAGLFDKLTSLKYLDLGYNNLNSLDGNVFSKLTSLRHLSLAKNYLGSKLPSNVFQALTNLQELNLRSTSAYIYNNTLEKQTNLVSLFASGVKLNSLGDLTFKNTKKLRYLNLQGASTLGTRGKSIFNNMPDLEFLSVRSLTFKSLSNDFANNKKLKTLILYSCGVTNITSTTFSGMKSLTLLDLGYNSLTEIPSGSFNDLENLNRLYLNRNRLQELPENAFAKQTNLVELLLNQNSLTRIPESAMSKLTKLEALSLSKNQMKEFPVPRKIMGQMDLYSLDLSNNKLEVFDASNRSFAVLDLRSNYLISMGYRESAFKDRADIYLTGNCLNCATFTAERTRLHFVCGDPQDRCPQTSCSDSLRLKGCFICDGSSCETCLAGYRLNGTSCHRCDTDEDCPLNNTGVMKHCGNWDIEKEECLECARGWKGKKCDEVAPIYDSSSSAGSRAVFSTFSIIFAFAVVCLSFVLNI